jgi:L,D-transpeptidase ErfK/SrfK
MVINSSYATTFVLPSQGNVVGEMEYASPYSGETLVDVGIRYDIGYNEMVKANPHVDPNDSLSSKTRLLIPSQFTLPKVSHHGIVISLTDYRLYYFPEHENVVMTYPVGIGRKGWSTPVGVTKVVAKQVNPTWHPSTRVQTYAETKGVLMPDEFPPGPGNPLGKYVLRLGWPTYLIHGSNSDSGIGEKVSAGCIRMLPADMEYLFDLVKVGTPVRIINTSKVRAHT